MSDGIVARIMSGLQEQSSQEAPSKVEKPIETSHPDQSKVTPPFSQYSEINKKPYSSEYFKIQYRINPKIDKNIDEIESFIKDEIVDNRLDDDTNTYNGLIDAIKRTLNIKEHVPLDKQLEMIGQYIKLKSQEKKQNKKLDEAKEAVLKFSKELEKKHG